VHTIERFLFRDLHPDLMLGTASDRYEGWMGQIYTKESYRGRITSRKKTVGGQHIDERTLPVDSVLEYFEHFSFLEVDFTFYRGLLDDNGTPTSNYHVLSTYGKYLKEGDLLILKVPQVICARGIWKGGEFQRNPSYLSPDIFVTQFYKPALQILGGHIEGFLFEQEYHGKKERISPEAHADELSGFFSALPPDDRYHLEIRTPAYLSSPLYEILEKYGVGQVFSHWTWLPPLSEQLLKCGGRFFNAGGKCVIRLITPLKMKYEDSYLRAYPFNAMVPGMMSHSMIEETINIIEKALSVSQRLRIAINNRAGGSAPLIARELSRAFLRSLERT
jgi:hypothetical protein